MLVIRINFPGLSSAYINFNKIWTYNVHLTSGREDLLAKTLDNTLYIAPFRVQVGHYDAQRALLEIVLLRMGCHRILCEVQAELGYEHQLSRSK